MLLRQFGTDPFLSILGSVKLFTVVLKLNERHSYLGRRLISSAQSFPYLPYPSCLILYKLLNALLQIFPT